MTFLTLVGGVVVFGLLWLLVPRASFMFMLLLYLEKYLGMPLVGNHAHGWNLMAGFLIVLGLCFGLALDIAEHSLFWDHTECLLKKKKK